MKDPRYLHVHASEYRTELSENFPTTTHYDLMSYWRRTRTCIALHALVPPYFQEACDKYFTISCMGTLEGTGGGISVSKDPTKSR
jgi:hypothetical protein